MNYIEGMRRPFVVVDHCPDTRGGINQTVYLVGSRQPEIALKQQVISQQLQASAQAYPLMRKTLSHTATTGIRIVITDPERT